jgi:6,7-dimethyl-8-ribityllumazine synthase
MAREIGAQLSATGLRVAIVAARFNSFITKRLVDGATDAFLRHGGSADDLTVIWVPGALEIPLAASWAIESAPKPDAVIAIGAVIRGDTSHYDVVVGESARGLSRLSEVTGVPVMNAILTCDTLEQAIDRAGAKGGNKGWEATTAAIEMAGLRRLLRSGKPVDSPSEHSSPMLKKDS